MYLKADPRNSEEAAFLYKESYQEEGGGARVAPRIHVQLQDVRASERWGRKSVHNWMGAGKKTRERVDLLFSIEELQSQVK